MLKILITTSIIFVIVGCASRTTIGPETQYSGNIKADTMRKNQFTLFTNDNKRLPVIIPEQIANNAWEKCVFHTSGFNFRPKGCKFEGVGRKKTKGSQSEINIERFKLTK